MTTSPRVVPGETQPRPRDSKCLPYAVGAGAILGVIAFSALINARLAKKAERDNPPSGRFVEVSGIRIHYVDQGEGEPLVLLHGNGSSIQDFESSGLIRLASKQFRVIAFDRPGFGHTARPPGKVWTPEAQAELFAAALEKLGVSRAMVLGHSWGASVAVALALRYPRLIEALIVASGYYYPTARPGVLLLALPALPLVGSVIRYSISPVISRLTWPMLVRKLFSPQREPAKFKAFPKEMTFRPSQVRAAAAETGLMIPAAYSASARYRELKMPLVIVAGEEDQLIDIEKQSARLHHEVAQSAMYRIPRAGHMVHQTATEKVMDAISEAAQARRSETDRFRQAGDVLQQSPRCNHDALLSAVDDG
jgi:pimeloyl-ACP methyl ester carboxylesterase